MATYVTHGRKYHLDRECHLMNGGENMWEFDSEDGWSHSSGAFRQEVDGPMAASYLGKLPCLHCVPIPHRVLPPLYGQTFGHEPVDEYDGTPEQKRGVTRIVCARCVTWTRWTDVGLSAGSRVSWPCTSAKIFGL